MLSNAQHFAQGYLNLALSKAGILASHIREQALHRAVLCSPCAKSTKCVGCGCATPALFYAPDKTDHYGKWKEMVSAEEWKAHKNTEEFKSFSEDNADIINSITISHQHFIDGSRNLDSDRSSNVSESL